MDIVKNFFGRGVKQIFASETNSWSKTVDNTVSTPEMNQTNASRKSELDRLSLWNIYSSPQRPTRQSADRAKRAVQRSLARGADEGLTPDNLVTPTTSHRSLSVPRKPDPAEVSEPAASSTPTSSPAPPVRKRSNTGTILAKSKEKRKRPSSRSLNSSVEETTSPKNRSRSPSRHQLEPAPKTSTSRRSRHQSKQTSPPADHPPPAKRYPLEGRDLTPRSPVKCADINVESAVLASDQVRSGDKLGIKCRLRRRSRSRPTSVTIALSVDTRPSATSCPASAASSVGGEDVEVVASASFKKPLPMAVRKDKEPMSVGPIVVEPHLRRSRRLANDCDRSVTPEQRSPSAVSSSSSTITSTNTSATNSNTNSLSLVNLACQAVTPTKVVIRRSSRLRRCESDDESGKNVGQAMFFIGGRRSRHSSSSNESSVSLQTESTGPVVQTLAVQRQSRSRIHLAPDTNNVSFKQELRTSTPSPPSRKLQLKSSVTIKLEPEANSEWLYAPRFTQNTVIEQSGSWQREQDQFRRGEIPTPGWREVDLDKDLRDFERWLAARSNGIESITMEDMDERDRLFEREERRERQQIRWDRQYQLNQEQTQQLRKKEVEQKLKTLDEAIIPKNYPVEQDKSLSELVRLKRTYQTSNAGSLGVDNAVDWCSPNESFNSSLHGANGPLYNDFDRKVREHLDFLDELVIGDEIPHDNDIEYFRIPPNYFSQQSNH